MNHYKGEGDQNVLKTKGYKPRLKYTLKESQEGTDVLVYGGIQWGNIKKLHCEKLYITSLHINKHLNNR